PLTKARWQVELFFKWIKQHLRIKRFYGTSENAVKAQIWITVSIYYLVAIVKIHLNIDAPLYTLLQILSVTLIEIMLNRQAVTGFEEAIARGNAAVAAGAEMAFVEAPQTLEEVAAIPRLVEGPCLLNVVRGGKTPDLDLREAETMGYKLAIVPGLLLFKVWSA